MLISFLQTAVRNIEFGRCIVFILKYWLLFSCFAFIFKKEVQQKSRGQFRTRTTKQCVYLCLLNVTRWFCHNPRLKIWFFLFVSCFLVRNDCDPASTFRNWELLLRPINWWSFRIHILKFLINLFSFV